MDFIESLLGMPWHEFLFIWKTSIVLLFTKYLLLTIIVYVLFVIALAISDAMDILATYTFYFFCGYIIFANFIVDMFKWVEWFLGQAGINLPKFFT